MLPRDPPVPLPKSQKSQSTKTKTKVRWMNPPYCKYKRVSRDGRGRVSGLRALRAAAPPPPLVRRAAEEAKRTQKSSLCRGELASSILAPRTSRETQMLHPESSGDAQRKDPELHGLAPPSEGETLRDPYDQHPDARRRMSLSPVAQARGLDDALTPQEPPSPLPRADRSATSRPPRGGHRKSALEDAAERRGIPSRDAAERKRAARRTLYVPVDAQVDRARADARPGPRRSRPRVRATGRRPVAPGAARLHAEAGLQAPGAAPRRVPTRRAEESVPPAVERLRAFSSARRGKR